MDEKEIIKSIRSIKMLGYKIEFDNITILEDELIKALDKKFNLSIKEEEEIRKYIKEKIKSLGN